MEQPHATKNVQSSRKSTHPVIGAKTNFQPHASSGTHKLPVMLDCTTAKSANSSFGCFRKVLSSVLLVKTGKHLGKPNTLQELLVLVDAGGNVLVRKLVCAKRMLFGIGVRATWQTDPYSACLPRVMAVFTKLLCLSLISCLVDCGTYYGILIGVENTVIDNNFSAQTQSSLVDSARGEITTTRTCQCCNVSRIRSLKTRVERRYLAACLACQLCRKLRRGSISNSSKCSVGMLCSG